MEPNQWVVIQTKLYHQPPITLYLMIPSNLHEHSGEMLTSERGDAAGYEISHTEINKMLIE